GKVGFGDATPRRQPTGPTIGHLVHQVPFQALVDTVLHDAQLIVEILAHTVEFGLFNFERSRVFLHTVPREYLHIDDGAVHARRHLERGILHIRSLLAEDGAQQLLFRRQLRLALGRYLAHQDVSRIHFGADIHDAGFIQLVERALADIGNIRGYLLRPQLGV